MIKYIVDFSGKISLGSWMEWVSFTVVIIAWYGMRVHLSSQGKRYREKAAFPLETPHLANYLWIIYVGFILMITLACRESDENIGHQFRPFWSWYAIYKGKIELLWECIWNVLLFVPFGCLTGFCISRKQSGKGNKKNQILKRVIVRTMLYGFILSALIETSQLIFKLGLFEWDDMVHNSIGSLLGSLFVFVRSDPL